MKNNQLMLWGIFLWLIQCPSLLANDLDHRYNKAFRVQRLSLNDGLSQSVVQDIIQDQDGYMWLATEDGLNRYDSYEFKVYRNDLRVDNSLHENWVISLLEEPGKGIWVGTVAGLSLFDPKSETFKNYTEESPRLKTYIRKLFLSNEKVVWIATDNGLFYLDPTERKIHQFVSAAGREFNFAILGLAQKNNALYVGSKKCLLKINLLNKVVDNLCDKESLKMLSKKDLTALTIQDEHLWIGTKSGLFSLNLLNDSFKPYYHDDSVAGTISDDYIQDFVLDKNALLWIATTEGLNFYNKNKEEFEHYKHQMFSDEGLSANDVISLYNDREGLVWLGTYGGGVNILDPNQHQFEHLLTKTDVINHGGNTAIHGMVKDRYDALWIASYGGGLIHYDLLTGKISRPLNEQNIGYEKFVWTLAIDHENRLWQASISELNIIDVKTKTRFNTQFLIDGDIHLTMQSVNRIFEDRLGIIWIVSNKGLFKTTNITKIDDQLMITLTDLTSFLPKSFTRYNPSLSTIAQDHQGNFWFGGTAGLVFYNPSKNHWYHFIHQKNNKKSLSNTDVQVVFVDDIGSVWVGTVNGLNHMVINNSDMKHVYFERITRYDGIPNDTIYGILQDNNKKIWLSTNLGIVKYSDHKDQVEAYRHSDGLSSDEFNLGAYYSDENGRLYFGSINGITSINTQLKTKKVVPESIVFSKVLVGDRLVDTYQLNHSIKPLLFQKQNESNIDISVANISFSKLKTQRYRYRIIGFDGKWNYLGTRRSIIIASLPQGNYTLEIQSRVSGRDWSSITKRLYLNVETSFWKSRQGRYLMLILLVCFYSLSLYLIARFYRKRIQVSEAKLNLNVLRVKEIKIDNELMMHELSEREKTLLDLYQKLDLADSKLDAQRYKDISTGFYRINYLYEIIKDTKVNKTESSQFDKNEDYYSLAILEINDYQRLSEKLGPLILNEFMSEISVVIKQKHDSGSQIYTVSGGLLLILSREKNCVLFKTKIINLREQILRSYFNVANGISESSKVGLSLLTLQDSRLNSIRNLPFLIELLLQAHSEFNDSIEGKIIEVIGSEQSPDLIFDLKSENIQQSIKAGKIKYHIVSQ